MSSTRSRLVWAAGLLAYLAGAFFTILVPIWVPIIGVVVLLACVSATGTERDDPVVMQAVIGIVVGGAMIGLRFVTGWARMDRALSVVVVLIYALPVVVSVYRIARPFAGKSAVP